MRNNLSQQVERDARETSGRARLRPIIPRNVRVSEAPSFAVPVLEYDTMSRAAAYRALAQEMVYRKELAAQHEVTTTMSDDGRRGPPRTWAAGSRP
jgi:chromosome partitioning protein